MKISRFIVMAVFGLGLISQNAFSYSNKDNTDMKHDKMMKHHEKKHEMDSKKCHRSKIWPLFNRKENKTRVCDTDNMKTDKNMMYKN